MRRFSSTDSSGNVLRPCGTWAMPRRTICSADVVVMSSPSNVIAPWRGIVPEIARIVVVLPAPLAPRMTTISPGSTDRLMWCSTFTGPYPARNPSTSRRLTRDSTGAAPPNPIAVRLAGARSAGSEWLADARSFARPQVGLDHQRIALHLRGETLGDLAAELHRHHPIGDAHHERHVMLDEQHGEIELVADLEDRVAELVNLTVGEPRGRFVHQQEPRPRRQRSGDLQAFERAERQPRRRAEHQRSESELDEQIAGEIPRVTVLGGDADAADRPGDADPTLAVGADHHVLEEAHRGEQGEVLERPGDAERGDAV